MEERDTPESAGPIGRERGVTQLVLWFLTMSIRGILLWVVVPVGLLLWVLSLPCLLAANVIGRNVSLSPALYLRWATKLLDALLVRTLLRPFKLVVPWPWQRPIRKSDEVGLLSLW